MERRIEKATLRSGDRVIFAKATDVYDVILITPSADEETLQTCSTLDSARDVARGGVSGGRLWWRHHSVPAVTEPYRISIIDLTRPTSASSLWREPADLPTKLDG